MKSSHPQGLGHYQDYRAYRTVWTDEERLIALGYKFLGWVNTWEAKNPPEYTHCIDLAHSYYSAFPHAVKTVQHDLHGKDITKWCTICKIYWKVDITYDARNK